MISQIPRARPHLDRAKTSQSPVEHSSQGCAFCWRKGGVWDKQSRLCWKKTNVFVVPLVHIFPNIVRDLENSGCPCPGRETQSECCPVEPRGLCPVKTPSTTSPPWKGQSQVAWPREGASQVLGAEGCLLSLPCRGWTESSTTTSLLTPTPELLKRKCSLRWNVFHLNSLQAMGFRRYLWEKKKKKKVLLIQSCLLLCNPMTVAHQAPMSMEFSRQEYGIGLSFLSPGNLPCPGIESGSPALQRDSLWVWATSEALNIHGPPAKE